MSAAGGGGSVRGVFGCAGPLRLERCAGVGTDVEGVCVCVCVWSGSS